MATEVLPVPDDPGVARDVRRSPEVHRRARQRPPRRQGDLGRDPDREEKLKLPKFSIHDLRRAWASAMHANGATLKQVSVWLGHSSIGVTERYIRVFVTESTGHEFLPR